MLSSKQCWDKWGDPTTPKGEGVYMTMWDVPAELEIGIIPKKIYCNRAMIAPLTQAFKNLIDRGFVNELKTWDGCFNVRKKKGSKAASLHSWGVAVDVNAAWNGWQKKPTLSAGFVKCFTDAGFDWGGYWSPANWDGMHFQLKTI
jgi:hypothetical protein